MLHSPLQRGFLSWFPLHRFARTPLARVLASSSFSSSSFSSSSAAPSEPWARTAGEGALLLRFGTDVDVSVNKRVLALMSALDEGSPLDGVREMLPAYSSLMVHFDPLAVSGVEVEEWCRAALADGGADGGPEGKGCTTTGDHHHPAHHTPCMLLPLAPPTRCFASALPRKRLGPNTPLATVSTCLTSLLPSQRPLFVGLPRSAWSQGLPLIAWS